MTPRKLLSNSALSLILLLGMVLWFAREIIFENKVPFFRDLGPYFYPLRFILAESLKNGELPLWNRHMATGFPVMAEFQSGAFYPPHAIFLIPSLFMAVRLSYLFHYAVAAVGSYALCRRWNYPPFLSLVGSILFTFGGLTVSLTNLMNHFQTAVWLPWIILLGERAVLTCRWKDFLAFAIGLVIQFLAGSPEVFIMSMGLLFADFLRLRSEEPSLSYRRLVAIPAAAAVLVAGLTMVQILPTAELFFHSRWKQPVGYSGEAFYSMHPLNLLDLFLLDREVARSVIGGLHLYFLHQVPLLVSYYMGSISLMGLLLWMLYASRREKGLILALVLGGAVFAMGTYTSIYPFFYRHLPGLSFFRFPEKFFFFVYCLLLVSSLRGLSSFLESDDRSLKGAAAALVSGILLPLVPYLFFRFDSAPLSRFIAVATARPIFFPETLSMTSAAIVSLERHVALASGLVVVLLLGRTGKIRSAVFQVLLVGVVFIDLGASHGPYLYPFDPAFVEKKPELLEKPDPAPSRLFYYPGRDDLHPSYYNFLKEEVSVGELNEAFFSNALPNAGLIYGFDYLQDVDALRRARYLEFLVVADRLPPENQYRLLGALNVKYLISLQPLEGEGITLVRQLPRYPSWLYRVDRVVPRAYVVSNVVVEPNRFQLLGRLSTKNLDPRKVVFVEEKVDLPTSPHLKARAKIVQYEHRRVKILASADGPGVLVLADAFYPGWHAYVDGKEERILRANFFFRAVPLPGGDHTVEFRYEPLSFKIGLMISLATSASLVVASMLLALRRRRNGA